MAEEILKLKDLRPEEAPAELRPETYFDFEAHPFAHEALFVRPDVNSVCAAIAAIGDYAALWLQKSIEAGKQAQAGLKTLCDATPNPSCPTVGAFEVLLEEGAAFEPGRVVGSTKAGVRHAVYVESGARVLGSDVYLGDGSIYVGSGTTMEGGVGVKGPTIIGRDCEIRQGAYLRGNCILGEGCCIRGELKNVVLMDKATFAHPCYLGDSICGYMTHFGNQATAANFGIYEGIRDPEEWKSLKLRVGDRIYDLGTPKMGLCMGDFSQVGCNAVTDPGTFLGPRTVVYPLSRVNGGFYGPDEVLKNKPMEHGVIERVALEPLE